MNRLLNIFRLTPKTDATRLIENEERRQKMLTETRSRASNIQASVSQPPVRSPDQMVAQHQASAPPVRRDPLQPPPSRTPSVEKPAIGMDARKAADRPEARLAELESHFERSRPTTIRHSSMYKDVPEREKNWWTRFAHESVNTDGMTVGKAAYYGASAIASTLFQQPAFALAEGANRFYKFWHTNVSHKLLGHDLDYASLKRWDRNIDYWSDPSQVHSVFGEQGGTMTMDYHALSEKAQRAAEEDPVSLQLMDIVESAAGREIFSDKVRGIYHKGEMLGVDGALVGQELLAYFIRMKALGAFGATGGVAGKVNKLGKLPNVMDSFGPLMSRLAIDSSLFTAGGAEERVEAFRRKLMYNMTPFITNALKPFGYALHGITAVGFDTIFNMVISGPRYKEIFEAAEGEYDFDFYRELLPELLMDIGMSLGTRGAQGAAMNNVRMDYARGLEKASGIPRAQTMDMFQRADVGHADFQKIISGIAEYGADKVYKTARETLGVEKGASLEEINKAYLDRLEGPLDKFLSGENRQEFAELSGAYRALRFAHEVTHDPNSFSKAPDRNTRVTDKETLDDIIRNYITEDAVKLYRAGKIEDADRVVLDLAKQDAKDKFAAGQFNEGTKIALVVAGVEQYPDVLRPSPKQEYGYVPSESMVPERGDLVGLRMFPDERPGSDKVPVAQNPMVLKGAQDPQRITSVAGEMHRMAEKYALNQRAPDVNHLVDSLLKYAPHNNREALRGQVTSAIISWSKYREVNPLNILLTRWGYDGISYKGEAEWASRDNNYGNVRFKNDDLGRVFELPKREGYNDVYSDQRRHLDKYSTFQQGIEAVNKAVYGNAYDAKKHQGFREATIQEVRATRADSARRAIDPLFSMYGALHPDRDAGVFFVTSDNPAISRSFNALIHKGQVFLNTRSNNAPIHIMMHESTHLLERSNLELFRILAKTVSQNLKPGALNKYKEEIASDWVIYKKTGVEITDQLAARELIAEVVAESATFRPFWDRVGDRVSQSDVRAFMSQEMNDVYRVLDRFVKPEAIVKMIDEIGGVYRQYYNMARAETERMKSDDVTYHSDKLESEMASLQAQIQTMRGYFHQIERAAKKLPPNEKPQSMYNILKKSPDVKEKELHTLGVKAWIDSLPQDKNITKHDVIDYIDMNRFIIAEFGYGAPWEKEMRRPFKEANKAYTETRQRFAEFIHGLSSDPTKPISANSGVLFRNAVRDFFSRHSPYGSHDWEHFRNNFKNEPQAMLDSFELSWAIRLEEVTKIRKEAHRTVRGQNPEWSVAREQSLVEDLFWVKEGLDKVGPRSFQDEFKKMFTEHHKVIRLNKESGGYEPQAPHQDYTVKPYGENYGILTIQYAGQGQPRFDPLSSRTMRGRDTADHTLMRHMEDRYGIETEDFRKGLEHVIRKLEDAGADRGDVSRYQERAEVLLQTPNYEYGFERSHSFPENTIAFIRHHDRTTQDGSKYFHVEEIQSDWMLRYRAAEDDFKEGKISEPRHVTRDEVIELNSLREKSLKWEHEGKPPEEFPERERQLELRTRGYGPSGTPIPEPPIKEWRQAIMRRAIRFAADNGYDGVSWSTGKHVASYYNLANYIDDFILIKGATPDKAESLYQVKEAHSQADQPISTVGWLAPENMKHNIAVRIEQLDNDIHDREMRHVRQESVIPGEAPPMMVMADRIANIRDRLQIDIYMAIDNAYSNSFMTKAFVLREKAIDQYRAIHLPEASFSMTEDIRKYIPESVTAPFNLDVVHNVFRDEHFLDIASEMRFAAMDQIIRWGQTDAYREYVDLARDNMERLEEINPNIKSLDRINGDFGKLFVIEDMPLRFSDDIYYRPKGEDMYRRTALREGETLEDYIGPESAKKLQESPVEYGDLGHIVDVSRYRGAITNSFRLEGEALNIGKKWPFKLMDEMMVKEMSKYVKQWGKKLEPVNFEGVFDPDKQFDDSSMAVDFPRHAMEHFGGYLAVDGLTANHGKPAYWYGVRDELREEYSQRFGYPGTDDNPLTVANRARLSDEKQIAETEKYDINAREKIADMKRMAEAFGIPADSIRVFLGGDHSRNVPPEWDSTFFLNLEHRMERAIEGGAGLTEAQKSVLARLGGDTSDKDEFFLPKQAMNDYDYMLRMMAERNLERINQANPGHEEYYNAMDHANKVIRRIDRTAGATTSGPPHHTNYVGEFNTKTAVGRYLIELAAEREVSGAAKGKDLGPKDEPFYNYIYDLPGYILLTEKAGLTVNKLEPTAFPSFRITNDMASDYPLMQLQRGRMEGMPTGREVGFHFGKLTPQTVGNIKAEGLAQMGNGRHTGHFGTGTYFLSEHSTRAELERESSSYKGKPLVAIDFTRYNLYQPITSVEGRELHDFLRMVNRFAFTGEFSGGRDYYNEDALRSEFKSSARSLFREDSPEMSREVFYEEKVRPMLTELRQYVTDSFQKSWQAGAKMYDSPSTKLMKTFGFDGIDVRHLRTLDNTEYGSVIYDVRTDTLVRPDERAADMQAQRDSTSTRDYRNLQKYMGELSRRLGWDDDKRRAEAKKHAELMYGKEIESTKELSLEQLAQFDLFLANFARNESKITADQYENAKKAINKVLTAGGRISASDMYNDTPFNETPFSYRDVVERKYRDIQELISKYPDRFEEFKNSTNKRDLILQAARRGDIHLGEDVIQSLEQTRNMPTDRMTFKQAKDLASASKAYAHTVATQPLLIRPDGTGAEKASDVVRDTIGRITSLGKIRDSLPQGDPRQFFKDLLYYNALTPEMMASLVTSNFWKVEDLLHDRNATGFEKYIYHDIDRAAEFKYHMLHKVSDQIASTFHNPDILKDSLFFEPKIRKVDRVDFELGSGKVIGLTASERMDIYNHTKNAESLKELLHEHGGIRIARADRDYGHRKTDSFTLTGEDLKAIVRSLTPEQRERADIMFKIENTVIRDMLNRASVMLNGTEIATVDNYWTRHRSGYDVGKKGQIKDTNYKEFISKTLDALSILQPRTDDVGKPIMIMDAYKSFLSYIESATNYAAYAIPYRNAQLILGDKGFTHAIDDKGMERIRVGLERYLDGVATLNHRQAIGMEKYALDWFGRFQTAALGLSFWVPPKQVISYMLAGTEIPSKYLRANAITRMSKEDYAELTKYSAQNGWMRLERGAMSRELGEIGETAYPLWFFTGKSMLRQKSTFAIRKFDQWAVSRIWKSAKDWVQDERPDLEGEALLKKTGEVYDAVINRTQPTYLPHTRPEILRDSSYFNRMIGMFMTQRNKNLNMTYRAKYEFDNSEQTADDYYRMVKNLALVLVAAPIGLGAIDEVRDVAQNRHWNRSAEKYFKRWLGYNIGNYFYLGHAYDAVTQMTEDGGMWGGHGAYGPPNPAVEIFMHTTRTIANTVAAWDEYWSKEKYETGFFKDQPKWDKTALRAFESSLNLFSYLSGLPVRNLLSNIKMAGRKVSPEAEFIVDTLSKAPNTTLYYKKFWGFLENGDTEHAEWYMRILVEQMDRDFGAFESSFKTYEKKGLDEKYLDEARKLHQEIFGKTRTTGRATKTVENKKKDDERRVIVFKP